MILVMRMMTLVMMSNKPFVMVRYPYIPYILGDPHAHTVHVVKLRLTTRVVLSTVVPTVHDLQWLKCPHIYRHNDL